MEQLEEAGDMCPLCMLPIEPEEAVTRVMEQPVHTHCLKEQNEASSAA